MNMDRTGMRKAIVWTIILGTLSIAALSSLHEPKRKSPRAPNPFAEIDPQAR